MNKKGSLSFTWIFVVLMIIIGLAMAQNGWNAQTSNQLYDKLNWTNISSGVTASLEVSANNADNEYVSVVIRIMEKAVDYMGYAIFELGKLAAKFATDNPDIINFKVLFGLLILSLIAPLIYPAFIIIVSLILIIKEYFQVRAEKKELKLIKSKESYY